MDARLQAILDEATVANGERIAATKTLNDVVDFFHASVSQNMSDVDWAVVQTKLLEMKAATPALAAAMTSAAGVLVPAVPTVTAIAVGETLTSLPPAVPVEASPPNPVPAADLQSVQSEIVANSGAMPAAFDAAEHHDTQPVTQPGNADSAAPAPATSEQAGTKAPASA